MATQGVGTPPARAHRASRVVTGLASVLLAGCASPGGAPEAGAPGLAAKLDAVIASALQRQRIAGVSVTVLSGADPVFSRGYGVADVAARSPATAGTSYRIGSISKLVTAVAVMKLAERGDLALDDAVGSILPGAPISPAVKIRHLLNHTAGLADHEVKAVERWERERLPITNEYVFEVIGAQPQPARPGQDWRYISSSFHVLGLVVEKVAGTSYESFIRREIGAPLGLATLRLCSGAAPSSEQASDYVATPAGFVPDSSWQLPGIFSAGGLCASTADLAALLHGIAAGRLLGDASRREMVSPTTLAGGFSADYGLGMTLGALDGNRKWGHTGGGAHSNRAAAAHYPDADLTVVVLMNTESDDAQVTAIDLEAAITRAVLGLAGPDARARRLDHPPERYAGFYGEGSGRSEVRATPDGLTYKRLASSALPATMLAQGHDEFIPFADTPDFRFRFQIAGERAAALAIYEGGWFRGLRAREP